MSVAILPRAAIAWTLLRSETTAAQLACVSDFYTNADRGGRADGDQKLGAWKESDGHAHLLCESGVEGGAVVRTTTEMQRGQIGFKTGWQSANPYGQVQFEILDINGASVSEGQVAVISSYDQYKLCGTGDGGDVWQFTDAMGIVNSLGGSGGAEIMAYSFRNDAARDAALAGQSLFSIDASMLNCKLEVVVKLPVPASGDLTFSVQIMVERDQGEDQINAALTLEETASEWLINTDAETADGFRNATAGTSTILSMATGLVCGKSETAVAPEAISISNGGFPEDSVFHYQVSRAQVDACEFVYWDPLMRPFSGESYAVSASRTVVLAGASVIAVVLSWAAQTY